MTTENKINISTFVRSLNAQGYDSKYEIFAVLCRIKRTRDALKDTAADAQTVFKTMKELTPGLNTFAGDEQEFFKLYNMLSTIEEKDILSFIGSYFDKHHLTAPVHVVDLLNEKITDQVKTVLISDCEQYGCELLDIVKNHESISFTLVCGNKTAYELLSDLYGVYKNVQIVHADIYSKNFNSNKYDLVFAIPVFGGRSLVKGNEFICSAPHLIALENLLNNIDTDGKLMIIVPTGIAFGGADIARLRSHIQQNYKICEVMTLPAGLFNPYTALKTYIFVFSTGSTSDLVLKKYEPSESIIARRGKCNLTKTNELTVLKEDFMSRNVWNIDNFFLNDNEQLKDYYASSVKKISIRDFATVFRGKAVSSKETQGNIGVINISNLNDTGIDYTSCITIEGDEHKLSRYILKDGDVLVTSRGTSVKIAVFEQQTTTFIPSSNIVVIRPLNTVSSTYLKLFLHSPVGMKLIETVCRGDMMININTEDLLELEIPLVEKEKQDSLVKEYNDGLELYKKTVLEAQERWDNIQIRINSNLY